jgi:hypothetical protein
MKQNTIKWLLDSDPSIRFQTKRDILGLPKDEWTRDQENISKIGWGKSLLDYQDSNGRWADGLYSPKFTSTHYTLQLLRRMEMLPNEQTSSACDELITLKSIGETDTDDIRLGACITGMGLGILAQFRSHNNLFDDILDFLERRKIADGAWNCRYPRVQTTHSSMHTTISVLEGLTTLANNYPKYKKRVNELRIPANEFLLNHELFKSHRTGEIIHPQFIDISFPPRWKYNILSALDYFRSINHPFDDRMYDAIEIIKQREKKGFWPKGKQMSGKKFFDLDPPRKPSSFNTLRALRVLKLYDNTTS